MLGFEPGPAGEKQVCYLWAMQPPFFRERKPKLRLASNLGPSK